MLFFRVLDLEAFDTKTKYLAGMFLILCHVVCGISLVEFGI
jgi:hypothetical protein